MHDNNKEVACFITYPSKHLRKPRNRTAPGTKRLLHRQVSLDSDPLLVIRICAGVLVNRDDAGTVGQAVADVVRCIERTRIASR